MDTKRQRTQACKGQRCGLPKGDGEADEARRSALPCDDPGGHVGLGCRV